MWQAGVAELPASEARHAVQVLRLGPGDEVEIFDGTGRVAQAVLDEVGKSAAMARIVHERCEQRPRPEMHLLVALIKNERFDWLVQKATELGAASIRPVAAGRSVVKIAPRDAAKRLAKWSQVAVEAAKQCGHAVLPEILPVSSAADAFAAAPTGLRGIPSVDAGGMMPGEFLQGTPESVSLAIGPEGDWTPHEMEAARASGFVPLDLGKHVLRSETAALHVLSVTAHHFHGGVGGRR